MRSRTLGFLLVLASTTGGCVIEVVDAEGECEAAAEAVCNEIEACADELGVDPAPVFRYATTPYSACVDSMEELFDCPNATQDEVDDGVFDYCIDRTQSLRCNALIDPGTGTVDLAACQ